MSTAGQLAGRPAAETRFVVHVTVSTGRVRPRGTFLTLDEARVFANAHGAAGLGWRIDRVDVVERSP